MKPAATTIEEKVRLTDQVEVFEGLADPNKIATYPNMIAEIAKFTPWLDTAASWRQLSGIGNFDTLTDLRNRVEKAMPIGSAPRDRQEVAAPKSPPTTYIPFIGDIDDATFLGEVDERYKNLVGGIDDAFKNLGISAETAAQMARIVPPLVVAAIAIGLYYRAKGK